MNYTKIPIEPYAPGSAAEAHAKLIEGVEFPKQPVPFTPEERDAWNLHFDLLYPKPRYLPHYDPAKVSPNLLDMLAMKRGV